MNDLKQKILTDLEHQIDLMLEEQSMAKGIYLSWATFWLTGDEGAPNLLLRHQRDNTVEYDRCLKALACICLELQGWGYTPEKVLEMMLIERDRQNGMGFTIAHDKAIYNSGELKFFAVHRITSDNKWYPFKRDTWCNAKQPHHYDDDRIVQAAAILLAHVQMTVAQAQLEDFKANNQDEAA
jgi:hypothetical protein